MAKVEHDWARHLKALKSEGIGVKAYAQNHGLGVSTLYRWKSKLSNQTHALVCELWNWRKPNGELKDIRHQPSILRTGQCVVFRRISRRHPLRIGRRVMAAILGQYFRQVRGQSGNRDKFWQGDAQCI